MSSASTISGTVALVVGLATCAGVGVWMLRDVPPAPAPAGSWSFQVPVTVTRAELGDVSERIVLVGDVQAPERAQLAFERSGRIQELPIRLGDRVEAGAVLARLDDKVMEEQVRASEATLLQAREMAALATREADRMKRIEDIGATASETDRAEANSRNEAAKVAQMEADLALQKARLAQGVLAAPFASVVTSRPVALGSYVDAGDPCCELLSLERREILLELPPRVAAVVQSGATVTLSSDELPGFELTAPLQSILPSEDARARMFTGVVRIEGAEDVKLQLRPGMFVRASLELRAARGALTVPVDCLIERTDGTFLAVVAAGEKPTAALVPVHVLARDARRVAVEPAADAKLAAGDSVILVGKENAAPGTPLLIVPEAGAAP